MMIYLTTGERGVQLSLHPKSHLSSLHLGFVSAPAASCISWQRTGEHHLQASRSPSASTVLVSWTCKIFANCLGQLRCIFLCRSVFQPVQINESLPLWHWKFVVDTLQFNLRSPWKHCLGRWKFWLQIRTQSWPQCQCQRERRSVSFPAQTLIPNGCLCTGSCHHQPKHKTQLLVRLTHLWVAVCIVDSSFLPCITTFWKKQKNPG